MKDICLYSSPVIGFCFLVCVMVYMSLERVLFCMLSKSHSDVQYDMRIDELSIS